MLFGITAQGFEVSPKIQKLNITHVCFANDLLLFATHDLVSIEQLHDAIQA